MSVHRSKRKIAFTEFEKQAVELLKYTHERMQHTPNRFKKFCCPHIYELTSKMCDDTIFANEQFIRDPEQLKERIRLLEEALDCIEALQGPLFCYWNLFNTKQTTIDMWVSKLNRESALICGVLKNERTIKMIKPLPYEQIHKALFLSKLSELQRYANKKIAHEPTAYKDYLLNRIKYLVDDAFCSALFGNEKIPETAEEYRNRTRHFRHSLHCLNALQRPLYALWNIELPSEATMQEWSDLIDDSIRLLQSVITSDRQRFSKLT